MKLHHKLAVAFFAFALVLSASLTLTLYFTARERLLKDIRQRLGDIVSLAALQVDTSTHEKLVSPDQQDSPDYLKVKKQFQHIRDTATDIYFVYSMRQDEEGNIHFVVDAEENPEDLAMLGDVYDDASELLKASFDTLSGPVVEKEPYSDQFGTVLSGYAPIRDENGNRVGVLGVDISAATLKEYEQKIILRSLILFGLTIPLSLAMGWGLGWRFAAPILRMKQTAEKISHGDLSQRVRVSGVGHSRDEIGDLADAFNHMCARLEESIAKMNEEVHQRREAEKKYRGIVDNAVEGIFQSTLDGQVLTMNRAGCQILGYESLEQAKTQLSNMAESFYYNVEDRRRFTEELRSHGKVSGFRTQMRTREGATVWVEMNAHLRDDEQNGQIIEGMLLDVSESIKKEQAQRERKEAEAASRAKSEFLSRMSHEIRTPMNAIIGLTELLLKTEITAKQKDYLKKLKSSSTNLLGIINDILDYSKIEAGKLELEHIPFSMEEVLNNLSTICTLQAEEKNLELLFDVDPRLPVICVGDPLRLGQVLINLCGNAVKFTENGHILVKVELLRIARQEAGDAIARAGSENEVAEVRFAVSDTGIGIPQEKLDTLFESFSQADGSITRRFGGTGLGLTICRQLVELMGGQIKVSSETGKGSEFTFTVKLGCRQKLNPQLESGRTLGDMRVLVVDDNPISRKILSANLESFSFAVDQASSGSEALEKIDNTASRTPYNLILMDWKMPGLDGLETSRIIKAKKGANLDNIPAILMVSAFGREAVVEKAQQVGIEGFLNKPVNPSLLLNTILEVFGKEPIQLTGGPILNEDLEKELTQIKGANLLVAEDNRINQQVVTEILEGEGFNVTIAPDGKKAVETLEENAMRTSADGPDSDKRFDIVLMDLQMPIMDGFEATRSIRNSNSIYRDVPIIALTAHAMKTDNERCIEAGMQDHVTKPIQPDALMKVLVKWIPPREQKATAPAAASQKAATLPDSLPGLEIRTGLAMVRHNTKLYLKLLKEFIADYGQAAESMQQAIASDDHEFLKSTAHTLKSVAGSLGALNLQKSAEKIDAAMKADDIAAAQAELDEFQTALDVAVNSMQQTLQASEADTAARQQATTTAPPSPTSSPRQVDAALLDRRMDKLIGLLRQGDAESMDIFEQIKPDIIASGNAQAATDIERSLDDYDFDRALSIALRTRPTAQ